MCSHVSISSLGGIPPALGYQAGGGYHLHINSTRQVTLDAHFKFYLFQLCCVARLDKVSTIVLRVRP